MRTEAVNTNNNRHNRLYSMAKGAAAGVAAGYVVKYAQPLTSQELNSQDFRNTVNEVNRRYTAYNLNTEDFLNSLKSKNKRSYAEDVFIKMFDGLKEGDHVKKADIRKALKDASEKGPSELAEFRRLCKESSKPAKTAAKLFINAYKLVIKHSRPTGVFAVGGAIIGSMIALLNNILRTEIKE